MKKPKFNFGDKVFLLGDDPMEIFLIELKFHGPLGDKVFRYNGFAWEHELSVYKEPRKKKLYAYKKIFTPSTYFTQFNGFESTYEIMFSTVEIECQYQRSPEYDITYPEDK